MWIVVNVCVDAWGFLSTHNSVHLESRHQIHSPAPDQCCHIIFKWKAKGDLAWSLLIAFIIWAAFCHFSTRPSPSSYTRPPAPVFSSCCLSDLFQVQFYPWSILDDGSCEWFWLAWLRVRCPMAGVTITYELMITMWCKMIAHGRLKEML